MANSRRGEVAIILDGREHTMRPTFEALSEIESRTGVGLLGLLMKIRDHSIRDIAIIVYCGIRIGHGDKSVTLDQVGRALAEEGVNNHVQTVTRFVALALYGDKADELEEGQGNVTELGSQEKKAQQQ